MRKRLTFLSAIAVCGALALPVQAETTADTVVAKVNDVEITLGHLIAARQALPPSYAQFPDKDLFVPLLNQMIEQELLMQSLKGKPIPKRAQLLLDNQKRAGLASEVIINLSSIPEGATQARYDELYGSGKGEPEYNAAHILVETEEEAQKLKTELDGGADFATLAKEFSTGPSGPSGGDLGWFGQGVMVPEFEAAVLSLKKGQVSDPVKTDFGWHVILLADSRIKDAPAFEEVAQEIENELAAVAVDKEIDLLLNAANVERFDADIDPSLLGKTDLLED